MALTKAKVGTKVQSKAKQSPGFSVLWFFKAKQSPAGENPKFFQSRLGAAAAPGMLLLLLTLADTAGTWYQGPGTSQADQTESKLY